jgi:predicted metal-dependent hydrolase
MVKENHDLEGALKKYVELLEEEAYFEAHEVLEEAWHPLRKADHPLKNLLKGLINGAIAFEHIKRNRNNACSNARKVMASFERYKHFSSQEIAYATLFKKACCSIEKLKKRYYSIFLN